MDSDKASPTVDRLMASAKLAEVTKRNYLMRVKQYLRSAEMTPDELVRHAKAHPRKFEESFISFLQGVSKRSSSSTTMSFRDSVKRFLEINRVETVNWSYVNEFVPSAKKAGQDRAPTADEIRRMTDVSDLRTKCLVLFLCSSGARIGSVPYLKWRDVGEVEADGQKFAKLVIYRGEPEEYLTFITPECLRYWQEYRDWREKIGEKVTEKSYVFVTQGNATEFDPGAVRPASVKTLKNLLGRMLDNLGMRTAISERGGYKNYEFKQAHGFRKFFKTRMELSGAKPIITEMLMGHTVGVANSYMKPTQEEMIGEYVKAVPNLTIVGAVGEKADRNVEFKREILLKVGGYSKEEVDKLDLTNMEDTEIQKLVRERLLGAMANNGNHQRVIPINEVETYLTKGWEYVAALPTGKAVLKLPN